MEISIKKARGRPTIANGPKLDPEYHKNFYREKLSVKIACDHCGCDIVKQKMKRHKLTLKCINFKKPSDI